MRPNPHQPQRVSGLQAEQSAADHDADSLGVTSQRGLRVDADRIQVVERAIDVTAVAVLARHRRDERVRAGGQHQGVVVHRRAVGDADPLGVSVDAGDRVAEAQVDEIVAGVIVTGEREQ